MELLRSFVSNHVLATVVTLLILVSGSLAVSSMRRQSLPEISENILQVTIAYPGANPKEVEEGISRLIEPRLNGMEGVKSYNTFSAEGVSMATIEAARSPCSAMRCAIGESGEVAASSSMTH